MEIVVAITGASGAIYAYKLCKTLIESGKVSQLHIVFSDYGKQVASHEGFLDKFEQFKEVEGVLFHDNNQMFNTIASGSSKVDAMVVVPGSASTMARIAAGTSTNLITRCADVMLKERRQLIYCLRETPLNAIHINSMSIITNCGGVIMPLSPSFYSHPTTIDQLVNTQIERVTSLLKLDLERFVFRAIPKTPSFGN